MKLKAMSWRWALLAFIPGCVLLQPLDEAKSDNTGGNAGSASHAGNGNAGHPASGGSGPAPGAGAGGSGPTPGGGAGGSGPAPSGGRGGAPPNPGTGGAAPTDSLALFTGMWVLTTGSITLNCPGSPATTNPLTEGSAEWMPGVTSDLVQTAGGTDCELRANISGRVATAEPSQECVESGTNSEGQPYSQDLTIYQYTFTVGSTGKTANEAFYGSVDYTDITGTSTCQFAQTGSYTKQ